MHTSSLRWLTEDFVFSSRCVAAGWLRSWFSIYTHFLYRCRQWTIKNLWFFFSFFPPQRDPSPLILEVNLRPAPYFNCTTVNVHIISHMGFNERFDYPKVGSARLHYCQRTHKPQQRLLGSYCYGDQPLATWPPWPPVRDKLYGPAVVGVVAKGNINVLQKSPPSFHRRQPGEFKVFMEPKRGHLTAACPHKRPSVNELEVHASPWVAQDVKLELFLLPK